MNDLEERTNTLERDIGRYLLPSGEKGQPRVVFVDLLEPSVIAFKQIVSLAEGFDGVKQVVPAYKERIARSGLEVIYA